MRRDMRQDQQLGVTLERIEAAAQAAGFGVLGAFHPDENDGAPEIDGAPAGAILLLALRAPDAWAVFANSPEARDGAPHPLDRWSRRLGTRLAEELGATALFPFDGPPYYPFLRWAERTGQAWPSPIGMSVHSDRGLWFSARFALATPTALALPPRTAAKPCDGCADRPCKTACPVDAFATGVYDVDACAAHLRSAEGGDCIERGCLARRACPAGRAFAPIPAQANFHMSAFLRARNGTS